MGPESFYLDRQETNIIFNNFANLLTKTQFVKFSASHTSLLIYSAKHDDINNSNSIMEFPVCRNFTKSGPWTVLHVKRWNE
jgi:hypothetical protein